MNIQTSQTEHEHEHEHEQRRTITSWSPTRASVYQNCPRQAYFAYAARIPEVPRPPKLSAAGKPLEHANDRGTRLHEQAETFVRTPGSKLIPELRKFERELTQAQTLYQTNPDRVEMEQMWCFDNEWNILPDPHPQTWYRLKIDLNISITPDHQLIVDLKSGRRRYNEIKHNEQMLQYSLGALMRNPGLKRIQAELWYTDEDHLQSVDLSAQQARVLFPKYNNLGIKITTDTEFKPKPSHSACRFCPYRSGANKWVVGTGDCLLNPEDKTEKPADEWHRLKQELTTA